MEKLKPIASEDRRVANIHTDLFEPFTGSNGEPDGEVLQVNGGKTGYGFHVYRMAPGQTTIAHEHVGDEEFLLIEGDLVDHDGVRYQPGDFGCAVERSIILIQRRAAFLRFICLQLNLSEWSHKERSVLQSALR